jgi:hypothetical protein
MPSSPHLHKPVRKKSFPWEVVLNASVIVAVFGCIGSIGAALLGAEPFAGWLVSIFPVPSAVALPPDNVATPTSSVYVPTNIALPDTPLAPTAVPSLCCLAGWDIFSADNTFFQPSPQGNCSNIGVDELGIHASNCGLIFGKDDIKRRGIYGLSMPIEHNVTIRMSVTITNLIEGEFWVGFSNEINPQAGSMIFAMTPDPGGVSVFDNDISSPYARYKWADMAPNIGWVHGQPWQYNFTIELDGNKVLMDVNSVKFAPMVAPSTSRLFIGYRSKPDTIGTYLNASISNLIITNNP